MTDQTKCQGRSSEHAGQSCLNDAIQDGLCSACLAARQKLAEICTAELARKGYALLDVARAVSAIVKANPNATPDKIIDLAWDALEDAKDTHTPPAAVPAQPPKEHTMPKKSNGPKCLNPECTRTGSDNTRGVCYACYKDKDILVKFGRPLKRGAPGSRKIAGNDRPARAPRKPKAAPPSAVLVREGSVELVATSDQLMEFLVHLGVQAVRIPHQGGVLFVADGGACLLGSDLEIKKATLTVEG